MSCKSIDPSTKRLSIIFLNDSNEHFEILVNTVWLASEQSIISLFSESLETPTASQINNSLSTVSDAPNGDFIVTLGDSSVVYGSTAVN